jgi:hypothetical protein
MKLKKQKCTRVLNEIEAKNPKNKILNHKLNWFSKVQQANLCIVTSTQLQHLTSTRN